MNKDTSPEGKLLHLIKNKDGSQGGESEPTMKRVYKNGHPETSDQEKQKKGKSVKTKMFGKREPFIKKQSAAKDTDEEDKASRIIRLVPVLLIALLTLVVVYLVVDTFFITPYFRGEVEAVKVDESFDDSIEATGGETKEEGSSPASKPYSYYAKDVGKRDIFQPVAEKGAKVSRDVQKNIKENFALIGVIAGGELQAAIEDKTAQKTYFVYKGDHIDDILIEDILVNKVILEYEGQKIELML